MLQTYRRYAAYTMNYMHHSTASPSMELAEIETLCCLHTDSHGDAHDRLSVAHRGEMFVA